MHASCLSRWDWVYQDWCSHVYEGVMSLWVGVGVWGFVLRYVLHVQEMCALPPRALYMNECPMSLYIWMNAPYLSRWERDDEDRCYHVHQWVMSLQVGAGLSGSVWSYIWIAHVSLGGSRIIRTSAVMYMNESCSSRWERDYQDLC